MSHTKGPWLTDKQYTNDFKEFFRVVDIHGVPVVKTPNVDPKGEFFNKAHQDEDEANANLIAAAPDMLEALELSLEFIERYMSSERDEQLQAKIETLIKKAKGE